MQADFVSVLFIAALNRWHLLPIILLAHLSYSLAMFSILFSMLARSPICFPMPTSMPTLFFHLTIHLSGVPLSWPLPTFAPLRFSPCTSTVAMSLHSYMWPLFPLVMIGILSLFPALFLTKESGFQGSSFPNGQKTGSVDLVRPKFLSKCLSYVRDNCIDICLCETRTFFLKIQNKNMSPYHISAWQNSFSGEFFQIF